MKLPYIANCKIIESDVLVVDTDDRDVSITTRSDDYDVDVTLYLSPASARELRKALKAAIKKAEEQ